MSATYNTFLCKASTFSFMRQRLYIGYAFLEGFVVNGIGREDCKIRPQTWKTQFSFFFFFQFGASPQKRGQLPALLESTLVKVAHGPHLHSWKLRGTESRSQEWITRLDAQRTHRFSIKNTGRTKFPEKRF